MDCPKVRREGTSPTPRSRTGWSYARYCSRIRREQRYVIGSSVNTQSIIISPNLKKNKGRKIPACKRKAGEQGTSLYCQLVEISLSFRFSFSPAVCTMTQIKNVLLVLKVKTGRWLPSISVSSPAQFSRLHCTVLLYGPNSCVVVVNCRGQKRAAANEASTTVRQLRLGLVGGRLGG